MGMEYPKVLVISHTSFTKSNSMGSTLAACFADYPQDRLAQFYIQEMLPDIPVCKNYYKVTDRDVLRKLKSPFGAPVGRVITELAQPKQAENTGSTSVKYEKRHYLLLLRNIMWGTGVWNNKKLKKWISDFAPDVILVQPGDFSFIIRYATSLAKKLNIPLVVHQSEAYYLKPYERNTPVYRLFRCDFKRAYEKMMRYASAVVYLCDALKEDYDKYFMCNSYTIMKSTDVTPKHKEKSGGGYGFIYAGNIGEKVGRHKPLSELGRAIKSLGYHIDVYTGSTGEHLKELTEENGIVMHKAVPYSILQEKIAENDFILHMENQDRENVIDLKYAFTTKIADMLASGLCPIIYGSPEIASIRYFKDNDLGCVIEKAEDIEPSIKRLIEDEALRNGYIERALEQAQKEHSVTKNSERMREILKAVWENSRN